MLEFRPHHFMCTLGFEGHGYSEEFVKGYQEIATRLRETPGGDDCLIRVAPDTDSICQPCPNRRENLCTSEEKIRKLDAGHARVLNLKPNQILTWGEAKSRIAERMTSQEFETVCAPCAWKALGVCEKSLNHLKDSLRQP